MSNTIKFLPSKGRWHAQHDGEAASLASGGATLAMLAPLYRCAVPLPVAGEEFR
jgi:hypothetical protein